VADDEPDGGAEAAWPEPGVVAVAGQHEQVGFRAGDDSRSGRPHATGAPLPLALVAAAKVARIQCLAVAEHARGQGIGETLLRRAVRIYFQLGWLMPTGSSPSAPGWRTTHTAGFTALPDGEAVDLDRISVLVRIGQIPGKRLLVRRRPS
jgi:GNAT superfamily N-acetyltransferase